MAQVRSSDEQIIAALKGKMTYKQIIKHLHCNDRRIRPLSKDLKANPSNYSHIEATLLSHFETTTNQNHHQPPAKPPLKRYEPPKTTVKPPLDQIPTIKNHHQPPANDPPVWRTIWQNPRFDSSKILDPETFLDELYNLRDNPFVRSFMMWLFNWSEKQVKTTSREKYPSSRLKSINGFIKVFRELQKGGYH